MRSEPVHPTGTAGEVTVVAGHAWRFVTVDQGIARRPLPDLLTLGRPAPSRQPEKRGAAWWDQAGAALLRDVHRQAPGHSTTAATRARRSDPDSELAWALYDGRADVSSTVPAGAGR